MSDTVLEVGKLPPKLLAEVLVTGRPVPPELLLPPTVGEDAGVIAMRGGALIAASDPVTLTGQDVGAHAVLVNANDIAVMGARPRWFTATVLLPPGITEAEVRVLYRRMHEALATLDAVLVGGHVEITDAVRRTVVVGHMMGLREDGAFTRTAALEPGQVVAQIGPAPVEGRCRACGRGARAARRQGRRRDTRGGCRRADRSRHFGWWKPHCAPPRSVRAPCTTRLRAVSRPGSTRWRRRRASGSWSRPTPCSGTSRAASSRRRSGSTPGDCSPPGRCSRPFPAGTAELVLATLAAEGFPCAPIARAEAGGGVSFESGGEVPRFARDEMIRVVSAEG